MMTATNMLTTKGKHATGWLVALTVLGVGWFILWVYLSWHDGFFSDLPPAFIVLPPAVPFIFFGIFYKTLADKIERLVLTSLGFEVDYEAFSSLVGFNFVQRWTNVHVTQAEKGTVNGVAVSLLKFDAVSGSGKNRYVVPFVGFVFRTERDNGLVEVFDKQNRHKPIFDLGSSVELESPDFNRLFKVYAPAGRDAFYCLDPDTINDLTMVRAEYSCPINLEFNRNHVVVYIAQTDYKRFFHYKLSFAEIMNGDANEEDLRDFKTGLTNFLGQLLKIYKALDLKAINVKS